MCAWQRKHDLIVNRVGIMNQIVGCRYDLKSDNPYAIVYEHGSYTFTYFATPVVSWKVYDLAQVDHAFEVADAWSQCTWLMNVNGRVVKVSYEQR